MLSKGRFMKVNIEQNEIILSEITILDDDLTSGGEIYIGRQEDCHIILDDHQVSRHHACLFVKDGKVFIKNLSEFGSLIVNGQSLEECSLEENAKIKIGSYVVSLLTLPTLALSSQIELSHIPEDDLPEQEEELDKTELLSSENNEFVSSDEEENTEYDQNDEPETENPQVEDLESDAFVSNDYVENDDVIADEDFPSSDGFDDVGFDDGFEAPEDSSDKTQVFTSFANFSLSLLGEFAPFDLFKVDQNEIFIGRNKEKCQIVLNDSEVSGVHAVIRKTMVSCTLEDLDSSNGTILHGKRINKEELRNGDEFVIGSTTFTVLVKSDIMEAEKGRLMPVEDGQEIEIEEVIEEEVDFDEFGGEAGAESQGPEEKSIIKKIMNDPKKKRMAIIVLALFFILILFDDDEPAEKSTPKTAKTQKKKETKPEKRTYSKEVMQQLAQNYELAQSKYNEAIRTNERGLLSEAKEYINYVLGVDPNYANNGASSLAKLIQEQSDVFARLEAEEAAEIERRKIQLKVSKLLERLREAVKKKEVEVSEGLFSQILEMDPENLEVPPLRLEIESYKKEEERKKFEEERKKAERKKMVDALAPGKTLFLKGEWYKAVDRLEKFTKSKGMDEDLINEATSMIKQSRRKLSSIIDPLVSKARSFKEGEDLKQAYETYGEVLRMDPSNEESLNEREKIFQSLENRSRKLYREALIAESLSLFDKAREKFQEVQQVSPINSEYFLKASEKLKNYLE